MALYYKNRIQVMVDDKLLIKIDQERGEMSQSVFIRKILEKKLK